MKNKIQPLITLSFLVFLVASCMVGPQFQSPETNPPTAFMYDSTAQADSIINLQWWEIFEDDKLQALIKTALINNKDALIAAKRIEEAAYVVGYNRSDLFPAFGYDGSAGSGNVSANGTPLGSVSNSFSGIGNVYWELDFWGKYRRATEAAKAELMASEYGQKTVQISLISNVATLYFQLVDYNARLEISKETLKTRQESLAIIQERYNKGIIPEIDLNQAQIQEAIAAATVPLYERNVAYTEHSLNILLGQYPGKIEATYIADLDVPDSIPAGLPSELLIRRPDILQAEQVYKAQNARVGVAQAMRFPAISLTGAFGAASADIDNLLSSDAMVWSVAGSITGPIFNFGKNKRRVDIERARAEQAMLSYEKTVLEAFAEVEDALITVSSVSRELVAYRRQLEAAENAAILSRERYNGGVTSYLEVLETERSLFESELRTADTYQRLLSSYVLLYKALGGGWISGEEKNTVSGQINLEE